MLDLFDELKALVTAFQRNEIQYALCGGLAMAVYGVTRATVDIDLLVRPEDVENAKRTARDLGFGMEALPAKFAGGAVEIHRVSKIDQSSGDVLTLDLLLATPETHPAWESRTEVEWEGGHLSVVSREGLASLKMLRGSGQDVEDIKRLRGEE